MFSARVIPQGIVFSGISDLFANETVNPTPTKNNTAKKLYIYSPSGKVYCIDNSKVLFISVNKFGFYVFFKDVESGDTPNSFFSKGWAYSFEELSEKGIFNN